MNQVNTTTNNTIFKDTDQKMPVLFVGHGSPMNTLEDNEFTRSWREVANSFSRPKAILAISAHWETRGTHLTGMEQPRTIHDFGGFPRALFEYEYPAPGSPELARLVQETVKAAPVQADQGWGLDHGTWSVLAQMYPEAAIPVVQLSLDMTAGPAYHYRLGQELKALRNKGILVVGSGNIVHNLRLVSMEGRNFNTPKGHDWAVEFDEIIKEALLSGNHGVAIDYKKAGRSALLSVPTPEHYLPLLYILGLQDEQDKLSFFNEKLVAGSLSMRSVRLG